jgi:DNA-directed RNA polymerase specialized sigma24 family protein
LPTSDEYFMGGLRARLFSFVCSKPTTHVNAKLQKRRHSRASCCAALVPTRRENETPEPEDLPDLEAERAFANAIIADGLKRNPARVRDVIADVARSFTERYSAEEVSAALDQPLGELEAHDQLRH